MLATRGYATEGPTAKLQPFDFERRDPGPDDVLIEILYCGICHSDIHQARDEWGGSMFPMVPGHEIVGRVSRVGSNVERFKAGDTAGVGCFVDSCRECDSCAEGEEQYCEGHRPMTYNGFEKDGKTPTYGGYSSQIVVDHNYVLRIPESLDAAGAAPLLCAGVTTYSPLKHFGIRPGDNVGVAGLGGLGHMGVKLAAAMGANVTVFSTSAEKEADARRLGASDFVVTKDADLGTMANRFQMILDTVSANHDWNQFVSMLKRDGTLVLIGASVEPVPVGAFPLILGRRRLAGSLIGGIRETQEMLDYCAEKGITSDVEVIPVSEINTAYDRAVMGDVRYRFVIDLKTL
jgi:uncharacterized zinc-type alcohol dehydrogenase-like protein